MEKTVDIPHEEVKAPKFDPSISYQWKAEEIFNLKGGELNALKNVLQALISTREAQNAIATYEILKIVDNIIKEGVEEGKIVPAQFSEQLKTQ